MKKILIVDYDQSSLSSLQAVLAGRGYTVVTAADGQAGWDKYNKECPDLVLMEAMLPKVHGFELCQRITSERNSQATVFIMTGVYKDRVYRTEALRTYGASEYFEKPLKLAELLASVEAVLGKPEARPVEEPCETPASATSATTRSSGQTELSATTRPAMPAELATPPESRRREKPKSDDSMFALPEDLDRLAREIPKARKAVVAAQGPAAEPRFDTLADDLLKSVLVESKTPKPVAPKPVPENGNGNGNGNGKAEIDKFLASALAGLDLDKEKVKVPKTAPLPSPPAPAPKPTPTPVMPPPVVAKPGPAPVPPPAPPATSATTRPAMPAESSATTGLPKPPADMKNTLTPGDPGSDVSPFFTPDKLKPAAPAEKPKVQPAAVPPAPAPRPVEKAFKPAAPAATVLSAKPAAAAVEPARPVPPASATARSAGPAESSAKTKAEPSATSATTRPAMPAELAGPTESTESPQAEPRSSDIAHKEIRPTVGGDIFQDFHPAAQTERSSGFPKIIPILIGIVAVAAVGFVLLRPKAKAPAPSSPQETVQNESQTNTPAQPVVEPPANASPTAGLTGSPAASGANSGAGAPVAKPAPAKQKVQPKAKPAVPDTAGADAILPILNNTSAALPPPGSQPASGGGQPGGQAGQAEAQQARTEETAVQSSTETAAGNPAESVQAADSGASSTDTPAAAPVKEGDLVELASVTEPPKLIKSADPIYPQAAQRLGVGGSITVNALIDEKGNVIETGILKGIKDDKGLGRSAESAVRKWKFQPARKNGVAVKVWKSFVIAFKAEANPANRME